MASGGAAYRIIQVPVTLGPGGFTRFASTSSGKKNWIHGIVAYSVPSDFCLGDYVCVVISLGCLIEN